jgi:hypothetical protein
MTTSWKSLKNSLKSWTTMGVVDGEELCKYLDFGHEDDDCTIWSASARGMLHLTLMTMMSSSSS